MHSKKLLVPALMLFLALNSGAQSKNSSVSQMSNNGHTSMTITDDDMRFTFSFSNESISFTEDEKSFKIFPADGKLNYEKDGQKLKVTADDNGTIYYQVNGGEKKTSLSNEKDKTIVADVIRVLIEYGIGAKERVARIYKIGGSKAVLSEVKTMKSDYVRAVYLQYLLSTDKLSAEDMTSIANQTQTLIQSDYEKSNLLQSFSSKYLANAGTAKAYLDAVKSIGSDYEKANAVKSILKQELTNEQFSSVLQVSKSINSDYEKAGVLSQVINSNKISAARFTELLQAAAKISSDYEKAGVLKKIFESGTAIPENAFNETLDAATMINSDYERAGVLKKIAESTIKTDDNWKSLLAATSKIGSDYEKAETLKFIAARMPASSAVKDAFMQSAKTIGSDHEYGKAVRAVK